MVNILPIIKLLLKNSFFLSKAFDRGLEFYIERAPESNTVTCFFEYIT